MSDDLILPPEVTLPGAAMAGLEKSVRDAMEAE